MHSCARGIGGTSMRGAKMALFRAGFVFVSAMLLASAATAQGKLPSILGDPAVASANPLPDFSYAGFEFGVAPLPGPSGTIIDVRDHGVTADDEIDDSQALLSALEVARGVSGPVTLRLPPGRIQLSSVIAIDRSDLVIQGTGSGLAGTELYFPRPLKIADQTNNQASLREYLVRENKIQREPEQNINNLFSEYSWSGGFFYVAPPKEAPFEYSQEAGERRPTTTAAASGRQFQRSLVVADASALRVGQVVQVQWFASEGPDSAILKSMYGDTDLKIGSHHWTYKNRPTVTQATRITAIRRNVLTLGDPLLHDVSERQPAFVAPWRHLTRVGIQNIRFTFPDSPWFGHHLEQGYNAIYMTGVFDGWIHDLVIHNADSGVLTDNAASLTISDVTTSGSHVAHYSVHVGAVHNVLVSNLVVGNRVIHPLSFNTRSTRSVYRNCVVLRDSVLDQHSGSNHQNLFDNTRLHIRPRRNAQGEWAYRLWVGGGAEYWKPGHGRFNTGWNLNVVSDGVPADTAVTLTSGIEGPGVRLVGLHGDRPVRVSYQPAGYEEMTGTSVAAAPSLYDYQLARRKAGRAGTR
jgi:hypothetical protein